MVIKEHTINKQDLETIGTIWLEANIDAHDFIPKEYWLDNLNTVKEQLPSASLFLYKQDQEISGFLGLVENYIAGIFVSKEKRSQGIGKQLLAQAKNERTELHLSVYEKNIPAYRFYLSQGFMEENRSLDKETGEIEIHMKWQKSR